MAHDALDTGSRPAPVLPDAPCLARVPTNADCPRARGARESERARISRELHDDIGQRLLAFRLDLQMLQHRCHAGDVDAITIGLTQAVTSIDEGIESLRRMAAALRPAALDGVGLAEALERLSREWADRCGLQVEWLAGFPEDLHNDSSSELSWALYRMAQESLGNIARHAQARVVRLRLVRQAGEIVFTVDDDGCGARPHEGHPGARRGLGLQGLAERIGHLGGRFRMIEGELGGCRLEARVPWPVAGGAAPPAIVTPPAQTRSTH